MTLPSPDRIEIVLVAAMGRRREIGRDGGLLFRLKTDTAHFRAVTRGKPVVMGRKTWESLPRRPLPGRPNIVVTRNTSALFEGAWVFSDLGVAIGAARAMAARSGAGEVAVLGGGEIYAAALPAADAMWLTEVDAEAEADAFFPDFDRSAWVETATRTHAAGPDDDHAFTIRRLQRAPA
ncbi:dihydrofolate reductase [bacterium]|nr:dihydrofolate reductase [bacterium]